MDCRRKRQVTRPRPCTLAIWREYSEIFRPSTWGAFEWASSTFGWVINFLNRRSRELIWNWMTLPTLSASAGLLGGWAGNFCEEVLWLWKHDVVLTQKFHYFSQRGAQEIIRKQVSWKTFSWVTCPAHFLANPEQLCLLFFNCFALRFVFSGGSSVLLTQLTICIREFCSFAGGWSGSRKFMIVSPIYLRTRWSSAVFWSFQNCLAEKNLYSAHPNRLG